MVRLRISLGLSFEVVYNVSLGVFSKCICHRHCLSHCFFVGQVMFSRHSDHVSERSKVSNIALWKCSKNVFVIVIVFVFVFVVVFFVGQVMFSHHSDQMSQRSKVSKIALWRYSLNVIVIVFVFVFAFVRSCFFMTPSFLQGFRFGLEGWKALNPTQWMKHSECVSEWVTKVGLELLGQLKITDSTAYPCRRVCMQTSKAHKVKMYTMTTKYDNLAL